MKKNDLLDKIIEAKEKIGDKAIKKIVDYYHVENFDERRKSGCCPFHQEKTPSFIWNDKDQCFTCFSCGRRASLLDMYIETEGSYIKAVKKLCEEANVPINIGSVVPDRKSVFENYRFPKPETNVDRSVVDEYCSKRGISTNTLDYMGVRQDNHGNVVFEMHDVDGTLVCKKYRLSRKVKNNEPKMWWDKKSDMCPILYNIDKIDITKPLVICEGFMDALSIFESGFTNVVSIPGGAEDINWIEFNYDILENVPELILWYDNDAAGNGGLKKVVGRLGEYKCKIVKPDKDDENDVEKYYHSFSSRLSVRKTDANNILLACGKSRVLSLISNAEEIPVENMVDLMEVDEFDIDKVNYTPSGILELDKQIYGFIDGSVNIWTAYAGCVDCDTEFFNGYEWKKISEWNEQDKVLQYNEDGTATLVHPLKFHKYECDNLWHFRTKYGLDQCLSDEHTVVYLNSSGKLSTKEFSEVKKLHEENKEGFNGKFIRTFQYDGKGISLSDTEIKLMCAVICDGSFGKSNSKLCRLHLKKDRKKQRLREILKECNLDYREKESSKEGYTDFYFYAPRREKEFSSFWYDCSSEQLKIICDNILFWDGYTDKTKNGVERKRFSTTSKDTADFVQFAFSSCGFSSTITINDRSGQKYFTCGKYYTRKSAEYSVVISERKTSALMSHENSKAKIEKYTPVDGYKYCFTVPSHMWVMRRNGRIVVTGNCGKTTLLSQSCVLEAIDRGETVFWFNAESTTSQMLNWILSQAAGREHTVEFTKDGGFTFYKPTIQAVNEIKKYYKEKIYVYDNLLLSSPYDVLDKMKYMYKKRGTKVYVIDNWLCLNFRGKSDADVTGLQVDFMNELIHFAKKNGLEVHLVAHPRKPQANLPLNEYEILGSSNIVNMADRIFGLEKVHDDALKSMGYDRQLTVFKDRVLGVSGQKIGLRYDKATRRLYCDSDDVYRKYGWDKGQISYNTDKVGNYGRIVGRNKLECDVEHEVKSEDVPF